MSTKTSNYKNEFVFLLSSQPMSSYDWNQIERHLKAASPVITHIQAYFDSTQSMYYLVVNTDISLGGLHKNYFTVPTYSGYK